MRITSSTYSNILLNSTQASQQTQATLQTDISSGIDITNASDSPTAFGEAAQDEASLTSLTNYGQAINAATTKTTANNQAMISLHNIVAQASELATGVNGTESTTDVQDVGTEMSSLLSQITTIANQQDGSGNYMFGGTSNTAPLDSAQNYTSTTNGTGENIEVQQGLSVQTGIVAGRPGNPPVDGFLYDSSSGVDVMGALKNVLSDMQSGNVNAIQNTDVPALNAALNHISQFVGSTAANVSAVQSSSQTNEQQTLDQQNQISSLTSTNLANASVQLTQAQLQYQASLESGTKILGMSILNYYSAVPNF
jgi:flagellar hook-associated protein 3 FlgL